jgi:glycerol-3-phosphate dehydrogenase
MVLVHGLGGSWLNWVGVAPALSRGARVLAVDLPGFGRSPAAGRSGHVSAQRDVLDRFLASVAGEPAIVVGNSMGGLVAMMEAAASPARVAALVLVAPAQPTPLGARIDLEVLAGFAAYSLPWLGPWYVRRRAARLGPHGLVAEMLRVCCVDPSRVPPGIRAAHVALAAERLARSPSDSAAFLEAARSIVGAMRRRGAFNAMVERIAAPALLVQGAADRLVPAAASRALARRRPDWSLDVIEDVGHLPQLEEPARFVAALDRWLGERRVVARARPPR